MPGDNPLLSLDIPSGPEPKSESKNPLLDLDIPVETKKKSENAPSKTTPQEQPLKPSTSPPASPTQPLNVPTALEAVKSQSDVSTSGLEGGKSEPSAANFKLPKAAEPKTGGLYRVDQLPEIEKESTSQLQSHVRETILGPVDKGAKKVVGKEGQKINTLDNKESIDSYANKLNLLGYSKSTTEQLKNYAIKLNEAAPALKQLHEELKKDPSNRDALFHYGTISLNTGDYKIAQNAFHAALNAPVEEEQPTQGAEGNPYPKKTTDAALLYGIGQAAEKMGDKEQARKSYDAALKADPDSPNAASAVRATAGIAWQKGDKDVARHLLVKAQEMDRDRAEKTNNLEQRAGEYDEQKKHENDTRDYLNNMANSLEGLFANVTGVKALNDGIDNGVGTLKEAAISFAQGNNITGGLQVAQGVAQIGMGTLAATPEGFLFNTVAGGAQVILPEKLTEFLMAPVSGVMSFVSDNPSDGAKALASFGDILAQALLLKSAHGGFEDLKSISEKFKKNEPLAPEEVQKIQASIPELTEQLPEAAKIIDGENAHKVQDKQLDQLAAKKQLFEEELKKEGKSDNFKKIVTDQIAQVDKDIEARTQQLHEESHRDAEQTVIEDKIKGLNKDLVGTDNKDLKATIQAQIYELTKQLTKKPIENEQGKNEPNGQGEQVNRNGEPGNISQETNEKPGQNGPPEAQKGQKVNFANEDFSDESKYEYKGNINNERDAARAFENGEVLYVDTEQSEHPIVATKLEEYQKLVKEGGFTDWESVKPVEEAPKTPELPHEEKVVNRIINSGIVETGVDLGLTEGQVKRGIADLKSGKDSADARKVKEKLTEIAKTGKITTIEPTEEGPQLSHKEQIIEQHFTGIREEDLEHIAGYGKGEIKGKGGEAVSRLISEKALPIDEIAQQMSHDAGQEITEQDVIDYVLGKAAGEDRFKEAKGQRIERDLADFKEQLNQASETLKPNENATEKGKIQESNQPEHQGAAPRENVSENQGEVGGEQGKPPSGSNRPESGQEGKKVTGIKKAQVEKERMARYAGVIDTKNLSTTDAKVFEDAAKTIEDNGPGFARALAEQLAENPKEASAHDEAVLALDRVNINNEMDALDERIEKAKADDNEQELQYLYLERSNLTNALDNNDRASVYVGTKLAQAFAIRRRILGQDFSLQRLRNNWFQDNPWAKELPAEVQQHLRDIEKAFNEKNSQLAESNAKLKAELESRAMENIVQSVKRVTEKIENAPKKNYAEKAKTVADRLRKLKGKPFELKDEHGNPIDLTKMGINLDDIIEGVALAIEHVGKTLDVVDKTARGIRDYLEKAEWYGKLNYMAQDAIKKQLEDRFSEAEEKPKPSKQAEVIEGKLKIPASLIREHVANGITNIDDLVAKIHGDLIKDHPNLTEREVRDEITNYGKQVNMSKDELTTQVNRMKRMGVLISKIEDAIEGIRPLRKLLNKDKVQDRERELGRKLNELLKDLPPDEAEDYRKIKTASDAKLARLNNQITDLQKRIEDLKAGREPEKTTKKAIPTTPEILEAEKMRDQLRAEATELEGKQELTDQEYLDKWKQRAQSLQKKYEAKIANKDYSVNKKRELVHDQESSKILGELEKVKKRYQAERLADQDKNTSTAIKAMKTIAKIPRAVILTSLNIFGKIGSFNLGEAAFLPIKELTQAVLSKLPYIGNIIRQAPTHGGGEFNVKAISKAYAELFNPVKLWKSWKEIAKTGQTDAGLKYGSHLPPIITDFWSKIDHYLELPGKTHAMVHEPLIRAKESAFVEKYKAFYEKKYQDNIEEAVKNGENVQDPVFLSFLQSKAYNAAYDDALLGKNKLSTAWNQFIRFLETPSKKHATSSNFGGQAAATGFKVLIPITTVPVNIANAIIDYSGAGLAKAVADLTAAGIKEAGKHEQSTFAAILHEGFKNMSEKDKEAFTRHITRGTIGAFLFWYGFHNRKNIGGIPLPGHHEKPGEEKPLHMRYFGYELPHWFHLPQLGGIEIGATFGHAYDYYKGEGGTPKTEAAVAVGKHVFESLPMLNEDVQLYKAFQSGERGLRFAGDFAKNALIPKPIQEGIPAIGIPGALPVNAHPKGFSESFLSRKPSTPQEKEQAQEEDIYAKEKKKEQEPTPEQQKVAEEKEKASDEKARVRDLKYQYQRFKKGDMTPEEKKGYVNSEDYLEYKKLISQ